MSLVRKNHTVSDWSTIGSVGSAGQTYAGHKPELTEPGTSASEVLALYYFGADGDAITQDETGTYTLTNNGSTGQAGGIFGGSTGAANLVLSSSQYFSNASLLDSFGTGVFIDLWAKFKDTSNHHYIFSKVVGASHGLILDRRTDKRLRINLGLGSWTEIFTGNLENDVWYHIALAWNTTNGLQLWVDSALTLNDSSKTTMPTTGSTSPFAIGEYLPSGGYYSNSYIAYFRVGNKVPTQKDVDVAYATTYTWTQDSSFALEDADITPYVQEDGNSDFITQYRGDFEVARYNNKIYRYGGILESSDKIKLVGRE